MCGGRDGRDIDLTRWKRQKAAMTRHPYVLAFAAALLTSCGTGDGRTTEAGEPSYEGASAHDRAWLEEIHDSGLAEIRLGGLAVKKGGSAAIRETGRKLVADHTHFDAALVRTADSTGVDLPRATGGGRIDVARRLAEESGGPFDRDFVTTAIAEHRKSITDTSTEVREGSSPEVTDLARTLLPILRAHLAMLRKASPVS